jgi:DNA-binding beta-propeller fold protein YncE
VFLSHYFDFRLNFTRLRCSAVILPLVILGIAFGQPGGAGSKEDTPVRFVRMFSSDADVNGTRTPCQHLRDVLDPSAAATGVTGERPAVCDQVLDIIAGKAEPLPANTVAPIQAEKMAVDSRLRVLITEPRTRTIHILDFASGRYSRIDGAKGDRMNFPYAVAVDANNSIYVTDLVRGRIAVYNAEGKFKKFIGNFKKGESLFQRPQSIAIQRATGRIYLADTTRNFVLILDLNGKTLAEVGKRGGGSGPAEFRQPVEIAIYENEVFVLDRQNNRIQVLDLEGHFRRQFRLEGSGASEANGMAFDTQGRLYVPVLNWVEVFNREGKLLFRFGQSGDQPGEFLTARGVCTDSKDRVYVMDSGNRRIQVFQVTDQPEANSKFFSN